MKVWVIMGNDYPNGVRHSQEQADEFIKELKTQDKERYKHAQREPRIYYRSYEFEMPIIHPELSESEQWLYMEANFKG